MYTVNFRLPLQRETICSGLIKYFVPYWNIFMQNMNKYFYTGLGLTYIAYTNKYWHVNNNNDNDKDVWLAAYARIVNYNCIYIKEIKPLRFRYLVIGKLAAFEKANFKQMVHSFFCSIYCLKFIQILNSMYWFSNKFSL